MKIKKYLYLLIAIVAAIVAAVGIFTYLKHLEEQVRRGTEFREVVVASMDIGANILVKSDMLEITDIPLGYVHEQAIADPEPLVGGITKGVIYAGEQVLSGKIVSEGGTEDGFSYLITPGMRAIAVAYNDVVAVGGLLVPGDRVDVVAVLEGRNDKEIFMYGRVIIQDIKVLAVGRKYDPFKISEVTEAASTVTLEVKPEETAPLMLAAEKGYIRLVLRSPVDDDSMRLAPWMMEDYLK